MKMAMRPLSFFLTISAHLMLSFGDTTIAAQTYLVNQEIESLTLPQATSGDEPLTYALTPELTFCFLAMRGVANQRKPS